ncbi:MAG TPA: acyloxyacyl hydrolase [Cryomorphaceae bacterium]|nr:acyloxyacyl hydrolase [Cryomorphaceae bacterium]
MKARHLLFALAILFYSKSCSLYGQSKPDSLKGGLSLSLNGHYGFVIPEYSSFILLTDEPVRSGEVSLEKRLGTGNPWNSVYKYPTVGLTFFYTTLGNSAIHGSEYSLFPFIRIPFVQSEKFNAGISLGLGLSYVTKKYHSDTNPLNVVVGSHLNAHFQTKLDFRYKLSGSIGLQTGLAFGHLSNANTGEPNIGINNGTAYLGATYVLKSEFIPVRHTKFRPSKSLFYEVAIAPGFKSTRALKSTSHFTLSATGDIWKPVSRIVAVGFGPDIFYDSSTETELSIEESKEYQSVMQWSTGIHGSISLRYDRLRLILQAGIYLGLPNEVEDEPIYNRAMVRYAVSDKFIAYFAMKSHLHILDHPEFGFGYRWGK